MDSYEIKLLHINKFPYTYNKKYIHFVDIKFDVSDFAVSFSETFL